MIRRLLRKSSSEHSSNMNNNNYTGPDTEVTRDNYFHSDPEDEVGNLYCFPRNFHDMYSVGRYLKRVQIQKF